MFNEEKNGISWIWPLYDIHGIETVTGRTFINKFCKARNLKRALLGNITECIIEEACNLRTYTIVRRDGFDLYYFGLISMDLQYNSRKGVFKQKLGKLFYLKKKV